MLCSRRSRLKGRRRGVTHVGETTVHTHKHTDHTELLCSATASAGTAYLKRRNRLPPSFSSLLGLRYPYACDQEGDMLFIKGITNDPCIKCVCKEGTANCITNRCMPLNDCPVIISNDTTSCCKKCKGTALQCSSLSSDVYHNNLISTDCSYLDQVYQNGEQWMSTQDSCRRLTCKVGRQCDIRDEESCVRSQSMRVPRRDSRPHASLDAARSARITTPTASPDWSSVI
ncbi:unnamed protein product [Soboliphyme baturini]|uniref:VWFC domain-containing protein n=1 Tax=Soboliphyme baturini TaxID=241478 RepID=A0A183J510_9BILA|nr:unnamed protein product [Soboliphyme baturini]